MVYPGQMPVVKHGFPLFCPRLVREQNFDSEGEIPPGHPGPVDRSFVLPPRVALYGGFSDLKIQ